MERRIGNIYGFDGGNYAGNVYDYNFLAPTLNTMQGGGKQPMIVDNAKEIKCGLCSNFMENGCDLCGCDKYDGPIETKESQIVAMRGRNPKNPSDRTVGAPTEQRLEPNRQGVCNTLTSVQKDNLVMEVKQLGFMDNGTGQHQ